MTTTGMWTPESPFLETPSFNSEQAFNSIAMQGEVAAPWAEMESPFPRDEFGAQQAQSGETEVIAELMNELEDEAFDASTYELAAEAADVIAQRFAGPITNEVAQSEANRLLDQHFAPLVAEAERMYEALEQGLSQYDLAGTSEAQLEALVAQFVPQPQLQLTPQQDNFLGGLIKKAGKALKAGIKLATKVSPLGLVAKGVQFIGKTALGPILKKLKALVRPLLKRVIQFAMNKLPAAVRPIAQRLSQRLFGKEIAMEAESPGVLASAASPVIVQMEYDMLVAEAVLQGPQAEGETASYEALMAGEAEDAIGRLYEAQAQLAEQLAQLEAGQDPTRAIQQFLPAALLALQPIIKTAIVLIGRDKVVNFIADLLAKLIQRWVGAEPARMLARPVVSVGLGLLGFESAPPRSDDPRREAAEVLAQTVQETVVQLAQQTEVMLEQPNLVQALVAEAFEQAAGSNFPQQYLREELRVGDPSPSTAGQWISQPANARRKYYKKWSQVVDVDLSKLNLKGVEGFAGASLGSYLDEVFLRQPGKVRIHVYELMLGARLMDIARREQNVRGLGSASWDGWSQIQPLTPQAAAILLGGAGLQGLGANPPDPVFLRGPYLVAPGQRFYYLEFPGAPVRAGGCSGNDVGIILNLQRGAITVKLRLSESTAQEVAKYLRRGDIATPIQIMRKAAQGLERIRQGRGKVGVRVVGETSMLAEYLDEAARVEQFIGSGLLAKAADAASSVKGAVTGLATRAAGALSGAASSILPAAAAAAPALAGGASLGAAGGASAGAAAGGGAGGVAAAIGEKILEKVIDKLVDLVWAAIAKYIDNKKTLFIQCAENPLSGVTVLVAFEGLTILQQYRDLKQGNVVKAAGSFLTERLKNLVFPASALPFPSMDIKPGCV